jgi:hypothetical protein
MSYFDGLRRQKMKLRLRSVIELKWTAFFRAKANIGWLERNVRF